MFFVLLDAVLGSLSIWKSWWLTQCFLTPRLLFWLGNLQISQSQKYYILSVFSRLCKVFLVFLWAFWKWVILLTRNRLGGQLMVFSSHFDFSIHYRVNFALLQLQPLTRAMDFELLNKKPWPYSKYIKLLPGYGFAASTWPWSTFFLLSLFRQLSFSFFLFLF